MGSELREGQSLVEESLGNKCIAGTRGRRCSRALSNCYHIPGGTWPLRKDHGQRQDRGSVSWENWTWEEPEDPQKDEGSLLPLGAQSYGES